ncbi:acyltransferase, partial [bacterium]|nr:acyltransferase [bacterium]
MRYRVEIVHNRYREVDYRMVDKPRIMRWSIKAVGILSLPLIYPLVILSKLSSETGFKMAWQFLSLLPTAIGVGVRDEFYRRTLRTCGENTLVSFGAVFYYPEVSIGNNVIIGSNVSIHHCDIGNNVMIGGGSHILSGRKYHNFDQPDIPIIKQGGKMKRVRIDDDVWIGVNSVIMEDVGKGSVVGAGSVVTKKIEPYSIVAGNPA